MTSKRTSKVTNSTDAPVVIDFDALLDDWSDETTASATVGKPLSELSGPAAAWFTDREGTKRDPNPLAVEYPAEFHAQYAQYVEKALCAEARGIAKALVAELNRIVRMEDSDLAALISVSSNVSKSAVTGRLPVRVEGLPRGESGNASVSVRADGALKAALVQVAPSQSPKAKAASNPAETPASE